MKRIYILAAIMAFCLAGAAIADDSTEPGDPVTPCPGDAISCLAPINLSQVALQDPAIDTPGTDPLPCQMVFDGYKNGDIDNPQYKKVCPQTNYTDSSGNDPAKAFGSPTKPYGNPTCFIKNASVAEYNLGGYQAVVGSGSNNCMGVVPTLGYSGCVQGRKSTGVWKNEACHAGQTHFRKSIKAEADYFCEYTTIPDNKFRYQYFVWVVEPDGSTYTSRPQTSNGIHVAYCHA
jgi:opacity protein-like surface antigen